MPKKMAENKKVEIKKEAEDIVAEVKKTEKEILLDLYDELKSRKITRLCDLENQIANAE